MDVLFALPFAQKMKDIEMIAKLRLKRITGNPVQMTENNTFCRDRGALVRLYYIRFYHL